MKGTKRSRDDFDSKPHEKQNRKIRYQEEERMERGEREMWSIRGREGRRCGRRRGTIKKEAEKKKRERERERKQRLRMTLDKKRSQRDIRRKEVGWY